MLLRRGRKNTAGPGARRRATVVCWIKEMVRGVTGAAAARGAEGAAEGAALGDELQD